MKSVSGKELAAAVERNRKGVSDNFANPLILLVPKRGLEPRQAYAH